MTAILTVGIASSSMVTISGVCIMTIMIASTVTSIVIVVGTIDTGRVGTDYDGRCMMTDATAHTADNHDARPH